MPTDRRTARGTGDAASPSTAHSHPSQSSLSTSRARCVWLSRRITSASGRSTDELI